MTPPWTSPRTWRPLDVARNLTAYVLNRELRDNMLYLYDQIQALLDDIATDWTNATLTSPWVNYGGEAPAGYRKVGNQVYLRGVVDGGTAGDDIFTLPSGLWPPYNAYFVVRSTLAGGASGYSAVTVTDAGVVHYTNGTPWVSLDTISFRIA